MVSIVLVSHSRKLAEGALELAREMGGGELNMRAVGGAGEEGESLGTDASAIRDAIQEVYSDDGVLVLMDLGSAVMNAELAVEMLPPEIAENVRLCDAPFVEGSVAATVQARIGTPMEGVISEAKSALAAKQTHLGNDEPEKTAEQPPAGGNTNEEELTFRIVIDHPVGLHARPAARFVETASRFTDTEIRVTNTTENQGPTNGKSIIALTALGVRQDDEIEVTASGSQTHQALDALRMLIENNFDND